ncbi:MAG: TIR domain-containing protein [Prosthecobacter sp.]|nr:TIR domain-containing protein [Prosthecobacter sp.]
MSMIPKVFLSLSGKDENYVETVSRHLPDGLAIFYKRSFENGQNLIEAMEQGVESSSVFVFFASQEAIDSCWVKFEIDRARIQKIMRPNIRILVFPLLKSVTPSMLPEWMREFWISNAGQAPKDVARYIRNILKLAPIAPPALVADVFGRGQLLDFARQRMMAAVALTSAVPNVFIFAGIAGIGRRTFASYFMKESLQALPQLNFGPVLQLPQFADLRDLYRGLRAEVETDFSAERYERDLNAFEAMQPAEQVVEVVESLSHFAELGQAVFAITGSGLFEDRGQLKSWAAHLFEQLANKPNIKLCLVSNRQLREEFLIQYVNVLQIKVPELKDADIKALMTATSLLYGIAPVSPNAVLVQSIGGHPDVARAAIRLIAQKGMQYLEKKPSTLFSIQEEVLSENLEVALLTQVQQEVLCILSWVPSLSGKITEEVIKARHKISEIEFAEALEDLILGCLVLVVENSFAISPAIRIMFRRKFGHGPAGLIEKFSKVLSEAWKHSLEIGEFSAELFDAFVFMHALEGKSLPVALRNLLLPSTLQEVVKEAYARGRDDEDADSLKRVTSWGGIAEHIRMDDNVREEILSTVSLAHIRLSEFREAEEIIDLFDKKGFRSSAFLRGFMLRRQGKFSEALPLLKEAVRRRKYFRAAVHELATCFLRLRMNKELSELVREHRDIIDDSAQLLDFRISTLIAAGRLEDARSAIRKLSSLPDDEGRATIREAQILIQNREYRRAEGLLTSLVDKRIGSAVAVRRWRAIAAANSNNLAMARADIEFIRGRPGRQEVVQRLDLYFALAEGDLVKAEDLLLQIKASSQNDLLRARYLEAKAAKIELGLSERESLMSEAAALRARNLSISEFDFE